MSTMRKIHKLVAAFAVAGLGIGLVAIDPAMAGRLPIEPTAEEEGGNNLSVPAIYVPSVGVGSPVCTDGDDTRLPDPTTVSTVYPGYYLQGESVWQADCMMASTAVVQLVDFGDNLEGTSLKAGTPIRVEVGLLADPTQYPMTGFEVLKLNDVLDRYADYGTLGVPGTPYPEVRVWAADATFSIIEAAVDGKVVVPLGTPMSAELNSTGRIVYGYNWGISRLTLPEAGTYVLSFDAPSVGVHAELTFTVAEAGGGGGGGGGGHGEGGGGHH